YFPYKNSFLSALVKLNKLILVPALLPDNAFPLEACVSVDKVVFAKTAISSALMSNVVLVFIPLLKTTGPSIVPPFDLDKKSSSAIFILIGFVGDSKMSAPVNPFDAD